MASNPAYVNSGDTPTVPVSTTANPNNTNTYITTLNQQVESIKVIMKDNVNKVLERDVSLNELQNRTENLETNANLFQTRAIRARRLFACKNRKWTIIIVICVLVLLAIIGLAIGLSVSKPKN
jgi:hypothetical protein